MKRILIIFTALLMPLNAIAYEFHQYDSQKTSNTKIEVNTKPQPQQTKVYDSKGQYQGVYVEKGNDVKYYNEKGQYQYQMVKPIPRK